MPMTEIDEQHLRKSLKQHEGFRGAPYQDTVGKWTIGYGHNLSDNPLTPQQAGLLLNDDIGNATTDCHMFLPWFSTLDGVRMGTMIELMFNLGWPRLKGFKRALKAMAVKEYDTAADEFMDSKWSSQVGQRAVVMVSRIRTGEWS